MADKELRYKLSLQDLFTKKMQNAVGETQRMDSAMNGLGSRIAGVAAGLGIGALAKEMVTTGAKFDSYKLQLETLLGSQRAAADAFNQIKQDAMKTPFDVASLTQANAMLISAGSTAGDAREMVLGLGNAIAATGGGSDELSRMAVNLQQIKTLGKASAMDIKQFAFAGIPIYQMLAKTMGKSVEQVREMPVTYEQLKTAFDKAAAAGGMFAGGLEKQSKAIGGQLSNLGDQFTNTLVDFYDRLKPTIASIISALTSMLGWVSRNKDTIIFLGKLVGIAIAAGLAYKAWTGATLLLETAQIALNTAMSLNPIGAVIAAVMALTLGIKALIDEWDNITERIQQNDKNAFSTEISQVEKLANSYKDLTKEQAINAAITSETKRLSGERTAIMGQLDAEKAKGLGADLGVLRDLASKDRNLRVQQGALGTSSLRDSVGSGFDKAKLASAGSGGKTGGGSSSSSVGSSTEVSSAKPQSLIININDGLVKNMTINATNLKESADKIKEAIVKVLLETTNDANIMARV